MTIFRSRLCNRKKKKTTFFSSEILERETKPKTKKPPQISIDNIINTVTEVSTEKCRIYGVGIKKSFLEYKVLDLRTEEL